MITFLLKSSLNMRIDVERFYDTERYRPHYHNCMGMPQFIMTSD